MEKLYCAINLQEAHIKKDLLENEGIKAIVQGSNIWGIYGALPTVEGEVTLWVNENEIDRALSIIESYDEQLIASSSTEQWLCASCGEESENHFDCCWNCLQKRGSENKAC